MPKLIWIHKFKKICIVIAVVMFIILSNFSLCYQIMAQLPLKQQQQQQQKQKQQQHKKKEKEDEWVWLGWIQTPAVGFQSILHLVMWLASVYVFSYLKNSSLYAAFMLPAFVWSWTKKGSHITAWKQYFSGFTEHGLLQGIVRDNNSWPITKQCGGSCESHGCFDPDYRTEDAIFYPVRLFKGKTFLLLNKQ